MINRWIIDELKHKLAYRRGVHLTGAVDWRSRPAARIAEVSQPTVDASKKIFKTHFAQCHTAWKRRFAS